MITLYSSAETNFKNNGIGVLDRQIYETEVEEVFNGLYTLTFKYPLFGLHGLEIVGDRIIKCPTPDGDQLFRIYKVQPQMGTITVFCAHIFYDLAYNLIEDINIVGLNGQSTATRILEGTQFAHPFEIYSDITNTSNIRIVRYNPVEALIDDSKDNTFVSRLGGEIKRDNFRIYLNQTRGKDNHVTIRHKKNLIGYEGEVDLQPVITRMMPIGFDGLILPEKYVDSPRINDYPFPRIGKVNFQHIKAAVGEYEEDEDAVPIEEAYELLREAARHAFEYEEVDIPKANYKIEFVDLRNTEEYKDFQALESIDPWDYVTVDHHEDGFNIKARMISYKYDPLNKKYISIELGNFIAGLSSSTNDIVNDLRDQVDQVRDKVNTIQVGADGRQIIYRGPDEPTNPHEGDLWFRLNIDGTIDMLIYVDGRWDEVISDVTGKRIIEQVEDIRAEGELANERIEEVLQEARDIKAEVQLEFDEALTGLETSVNNQLDNVNSILEGKISDLDKDFSNQIYEFRTDVSAQFLKFEDEVDGKIAVVQTTIDSQLLIFKDEVAGQLTAFETGVNGQLLQINNDLTGQINVVQSTLTGNISQVENKLTGEISTTNQTVSGLQDTVSGPGGLTSQVTQLASQYNVVVSGLDQLGNTVNSNYTQLSNMIDLRVEVGEVINSINVSTEGVMINGNRLHITAQTYIDNAVIKSAMIQDLEADKLTVGSTLNANNVNIINLNASSIATGILTGIKISGVTVDVYNQATQNRVFIADGNIDIGVGAGISTRFSGRGMRWTVYPNNASQLNTKYVDMNWAEFNFPGYELGWNGICVDIGTFGDFAVISGNNNKRGLLWVTQDLVHIDSVQLWSAKFMNDVVNGNAHWRRATGSLEARIGTTEVGNFHIASNNTNRITAHGAGATITGTGTISGNANIGGNLDVNGNIFGNTVSSANNGWIDLIPNGDNFWHFQEGGICRVRRINNVVEVQAELTPRPNALNNLVTTSTVNMFTLPAGYRPTNTFSVVFTPVGAGTTAINARWNCTVNPSGIVTANRCTFTPTVGNANGTGTNFRLQATFTIF